MVQKRAFDDGALHETSFKLRRQEQFCDQPVLFPGYDFYDGFIVKTNSSGEHEDWLPQRVANDNEISYSVTKPPLIDRNYDCQADEDMSPVESSSMNFPSEYFHPERRCSASNHSYDSYGCLLQNPPQKVVLIGPDHQADIPAWGQQDIPVSVSETWKTAPDFASADDTEKRPAGICILPMPDFKVCEIGKDLVGAGRSDCGCQDVGSLRCVRQRQHIAEAREKLRTSIGEDVFLAWSCHDVGEQVADSWLEEEEELFQDVVFSYASCTSKNFWNYLSFAFPSRTKAEIVRYYYNVFVLRRRAKQNRCDPSNIDSDDEWHVGDDKDEDSVIESPEEVCPASDIGLEEVNESDDDLAEDTIDGGSDAAETCPSKVINDDGTQDDSCTSFESVDTLTEAQFKADNVDLWPDEDGQNYITESGDIKFWGLGNFSYLSREVDFLPTFSMIEEAFEDAPWNINPDANGFS